MHVPKWELISLTFDQFPLFKAVSGPQVQAEVEIVPNKGELIGGGVHLHLDPGWRGWWRSSFPSVPIYPLPTYFIFLESPLGF